MSRSILALFCLAALPALALEISTGAVHHQTFQVNDEHVATIRLTGASLQNGAVEARLLDDRRQVVRDWEALGSSVDGAWQGDLTLPLGGPYRVDFRLQVAGATVEETFLHNLLAGDLWILAGQSNMQGVGNLDDTMTEPHPQVHHFAMDRTWRVAREPLHVLQESPDPVHTRPKDDAERAAGIAAAYAGNKGAGLGLPFAREMVRRTGRPVGLLATAHGGTSMDQWDPAQRDAGGDSLYGSMYKRVLDAGGKVTGVLWYQGESDTGPDTAPVFREKFERLIAAFRSDFNNPDLPFYYVQIGRFVVPGRSAAEWNVVQAEQLAVEASVPNTGLVVSVDLALDDLIHIGTPGLNTLGQRLAIRAEADLFGTDYARGPRLAVVERADTPYGKTLRVQFDTVNGALQSAGLPHGFSISKDPDGEDVPCIYKTVIDPEAPDTVILYVWEFPENAHLWYGRGLDPYCNIVDDANLAVPVFGPVAIPE